jgi:RNA polymerase sigma factor (sigma-70 family)
MLDDPHEAEDALQEVFLRAHRAWKRYDPSLSAPRTWLGQIAMNHCRTVLRRRRRIWPRLRLPRRQRMRRRPRLSRRLCQRHRRRRCRPTWRRLPWQPREKQLQR